MPLFEEVELEVTPILTVTLSDTDTDADVTVIAAGEVDMHTAPVLAEVLEAGCAAAKRKGALAVDLAGIRFFSVAGLTVLLTTRQRCRDNQVPLLVVAPDSVLRPLRLTGLDDLFDIVPVAGTVTQYSAVPQAVSASHTGSTVSACDPARVEGPRRR